MYIHRYAADHFREAVTIFPQKKRLQAASNSNTYEKQFFKTLATGWQGNLVVIWANDRQFFPVFGSLVNVTEGRGWLLTLMRWTKARKTENDLFKLQREFFASECEHSSSVVKAV